MEGHYDVLTSVEDAFRDSKRSYEERFRKAANKVYRNLDGLSEAQLLQLSELYNTNFRFYLTKLRREQGLDSGENPGLDKILKDRRNSVIRRVSDFNKNLNDYLGF